MLSPSRTTVEKNFLRRRRAIEFSHSLGQSRPGRASSRSSHVRCTPIATDFCGVAEFRDVPMAPCLYSLLALFVLHLIEGHGLVDVREILGGAVGSRLG
jgi:hypothetical protein